MNVVLFSVIRIAPLTITKVKSTSTFSFFSSSVFSCSSVLDSLLFKSTQDQKIQNILLKNIVNPLRK